MIPAIDAPDHDHVADVLAGWAAEDPALDLSTVAVIGRILRAARHLSQEIESELLDGFGLDIPEFNVLSALRRQGPPYQLTPTALSGAVLFTSGGLTRVIERLQRAGLVRRQRDDEDRRIVRVRLTDAGYKLQAAAMRAHLANQSRLLEPLDSAERAAIAAALRRLLVDLDEGFPRRPAAAPRRRQPGPAEARA